jgi:hypothetical protein
VGNRTSVNVVGTVRSGSGFVATYRQGTGSWQTPSASAGVAVTVPGSVEIKVYRQSVGPNDSAARTYTVSLVSGDEPTPPAGTWRDYVSSVSVELTTNQPAFNIYYSRVTLVIKPEYADQIQSITVKGVTAVKQAGSPETWIASDLEGSYAADGSDLSDSDVVIRLKDAGGGDWPQISNINVELTTNQPAFNIYFSRVTLTIDPAYAGQIQSISVKGVAAVKQAGTPETWIASEVAGRYAADGSDLTASDIIVTPIGGGTSREEVDVQGAWQNPPISRVTKTNMSQPAFSIDLVDVRVYTNASVGSVTVKGVAAENQGSGVWKASLRESYNGFSLSPANIVTDYTSPVGPGEAKLITRVQIAYDPTMEGYLAYINVDPNEGNNVLTIEVTDTAGTLIASLANGKLSQSGTRPYQFGGTVESTDSASLDGKAVIVKVTTAAKADEQSGVYGQTLNY